MTFEKTSSTLRLALGATALTLIGGVAQADIQHLDDVIIAFSLCVGNDCVNGESFGFDTIRLKENNIRIKFDDTSTSASFPRNDWQLTANDTSNGGAEKFAIDDITNNRTPFTIEGNTPNNSLYVSDSADVGFGTATPVVNLHVVDGNTPTLRLEQNGSQGFTAQTFDVAGNEANFFIRDVTNGSFLPFRIEPSTPTNTLYLDSTGNIGMGAGQTPTAPLHIKRSNGTAQFLVEEAIGTTTARTMVNLINNGRPDIILANTGSGQEWAIGGGTNFVMKAGALGSTDAAKTKHFDLNGATGNLVITGTITTGGGVCGGGCDRVFDESYALPSIEQHAALMWEKRYLPNVGATEENAPINVSDKLGRMLNELEHAHIYIEQLNADLKTQSAENATQMALIAELSARLEQLEASRAE